MNSSSHQQRYLYEQAPGSCRTALERDPRAASVSREGWEVSGPVRNHLPIAVLPWALTFCSAELNFPLGAILWWDAAASSGSHFS